MLRKNSVGSNNWGKLNAWNFVRELAPHILSINQEEADSLLYPELVLGKIMVVQGMGPPAVVCSVTTHASAQAVICPSSEVCPSSPGLLPYGHTTWISLIVWPVWLIIFLIQQPELPERVHPHKDKWLEKKKSRCLASSSKNAIDFVKIISWIQKKGVIISERILFYL